MVDTQEPATTLTAPIASSNEKGGAICVAYLILVVVSSVICFYAAWPVVTSFEPEICRKLRDAVDAAKLPAGTEPESAITKIIESSSCSAGGSQHRSSFSLLSMTKDQALLFLVLLAGAIGAATYGLRSSIWHLGKSEFKKSWFLWYIAQPFMGATLGMIAYLVFRAGFVNPISSDQLNPFGFVALAGVAGLFVEQTFSQLKDVAESLLKQAPKAEGEQNARSPNP